MEQGVWHIDGIGAASGQSARRCSLVLLLLLLLSAPSPPQRWGLPRLTRTRKENRRKDIKLFNQNIDILKAAAHMQPEVPVQLYKPLPQWQIDRMRQRLEAAQEEINIRAAGPIVADQLLRQRTRPQQQQQQRQLAGPPVDPQLQQRLNQQEVTRIKQQQARRFMREQQQLQSQPSAQEQQSPPDSQKQQQQQ